MSYPDLTLSYAEKWDLPFPLPREIWVRDYVHSIPNNVAPPRKSYRIGPLLTHKNGCGGATSVTERSCGSPIYKVESHRIGVYTTGDSFMRRKAFRFRVGKAQEQHERYKEQQISFTTIHPHLLPYYADANTRLQRQNTFYNAVSIFSWLSLKFKAAQLQGCFNFPVFFRLTRNNSSSFFDPYDHMTFSRSCKSC